jgi:hypothetical protein
MRTFIFIAITLLSVEAFAAKETCTISTGYGTAIGKGETKKEALANAREICGEKIIDQYFAQRRQIAADATDDLALACVNLECTK